MKSLVHGIVHFETSCRTKISFFLVSGPTGSLKEGFNSIMYRFLLLILVLDPTKSVKRGEIPMM